MSRESGKQDGGDNLAACHECHYEKTPYLNDPSCGLCMDPVRQARCVPINYVEKVCAIVPQHYYIPSPYKLDDKTTYKGDFVPLPYEKTNPFIPGRRIHKSSFLFGGLSEYNYSYVPYQVTPYTKPPWSKIGEYKGTEGSVNGVSSYKAAYQPHCGAPAKICRPKPYKDPNPGPMDDLTTYKMQFVPFDHTKLCMIKPAERVIGTYIEPFRGITMCNSSYLPPCHQQKAINYKPKYKYRPLDYKFEEDTTYSAAYRPFAFQKCTPTEQRDCYIFKDLKL